MTNRLKLLGIAALIGIINGIVFVIFELIVTQGTDYVWNNFFNTDINRWTLIPVSILLSIIFSAIIKFFKQKRIGLVEENLLNDNNPIKNTSLYDLLAIFVIGSASLLAGASLGPEASLVGIASGLGLWFAQKNKTMEAAKLLALSSVGSLLVAFFGSLMPILIPILILYKKENKIIFSHILPPIISGVFAYIALVALKGSAIGFGTIPVGTTDHEIQDIIAAFILGILGAVFAILLKELIKKFSNFTTQINPKIHWVVSATIFGGVIGVLYLIGGPSIQFSGKEGTEILLQNPASYTVAALLLIVITKLLATSWSLSAGYRGGLVFPSVFMGVALSLMFEKINPILTGPGIMIGSISGIFTALINPILGFILILSMIPYQLILVAIAGLIGALIGTRLTSKLVTSKNN